MRRDLLLAVAHRGSAADDAEETLDRIESDSEQKSEIF